MRDSYVLSFSTAFMGYVDDKSMGLVRGKQLSCESRAVTERRIRRISKDYRVGLGISALERITIRI